MSKEKRNVKPILLATSIIGFVLFAFVIALGVCMTMLYVDTDLLPIKTSRLCEIHIGVGILTAAALVCAILFMVWNKNYNSTCKSLNNKTMLILNIVFWSLIALVVAFGIWPSIGKKPMTGTDRRLWMFISWFATGFLVLPISIINVIGYVKSK